jgi:hypothetical protein
MATLEDVQKRRADRREASDKLRDAQEVVDLEAIDAIEVAEGVMLHTMSANRYEPGVAVKIGFRAPTAGEYKRYLETIGIAQQRQDSKGRNAALTTLAASCLVYPAGDAQKAMLNAFPGTLVSLAMAAAKVAELREEEEKNV